MKNSTVWMPGTPSCRNTDNRGAVTSPDVCFTPCSQSSHHKVELITAFQSHKCHENGLRRQFPPLGKGWFGGTNTMKPETRSNEAASCESESLQTSAKTSLSLLKWAPGRHCKEDQEPDQEPLMGSKTAFNFHKTLKKITEEHECL